MAQVQFYRAPLAKAAAGLDINGNAIPRDSIIFGYELTGTKGKLFMQQGDPGTTGRLVCYGNIDFDLKTIDGNAILGEGNLDLAGFLKVNSSWQVEKYSGLPMASDARIGDVWMVTSTGEKFYVKSKTTNNNLYVRFVQKEGNDYTITIDCGDNHSNVLSEMQYRGEIQNPSIKKKFSSFPKLDSMYIESSVRTSLGLGSLGGFRLVPVNTSKYGIIIILVIDDVDQTTSDAAGTIPCYALSKAGCVEMNSWRHTLYNTGELVKLTNGAIPTANLDINEFYTFGGGVQWELLGGGGESAAIAVDDDLTDTSNNPTKGSAVKQYIDSKVTDLNARIDGIGSSFELKGSVANMTALEALTGVSNGDVYYVESEQTAYFAMVSGGVTTWKQFAALNLEWK